MQITDSLVNRLMEEALMQARLAFDLGEVPVGAVVACDGKIIARAHNLVEVNKAISQHAEILALESAAQANDNWRLTNATLCVTIEPCTMCTGAIKFARIQTLIFGATDASMGACGSLYDISQDPRVGHIPRVIQGVRADECGALMKDFFAGRRNKAKPTE